MAKTVTGYHGTLSRYADEMAAGQFDPARATRISRWLGSGLYFFEDNYEAARHYAAMRGMAKGEDGAVVRAEIDLTACLDLTQLMWQGVVRDTYLGLCREGRIGPGVGPTQKPLEIHNGHVRAGFRGQWKDYGANSLDYFVIEETILIAREKLGLSLDTVRGAFIEGAELYENSWLFSGAHVSIAVRDPARLRNLAVIANS